MGGFDTETGEVLHSGLEMTTARHGDLIGISLNTEYALWNYDIDSWPPLACDIAGRNMTQREWADFGPQGVEYRVTCPQVPAGYLIRYRRKGCHLSLAGPAVQ